MIPGAPPQTPAMDFSKEPTHINIIHSQKGIVHKKSIDFLYFTFFLMAAIFEV